MIKIVKVVLNNITIKKIDRKIDRKINRKINKKKKKINVTFFDQNIFYLKFFK